MKNSEEIPEYISKKTKRGMLLLVFICLCIVYTPRVLSLFKNQDAVQLSQQEIQKIEELKTEYKKNKFRKRNSFKKRVYRRPPAKFNPNEYTKADWMYVGLSEKQAAVMLKITSKGVWSNTFLQKIVVIPPEVYELIKDSTVYPKKTYLDNQRTEYPLTKTKEKPLIEINSANAEELETLPGIGPTFAKRIVAYREILGGYSNKDQILEVYGMDQEKFSNINSLVVVNMNEIKKMNINTADVNELKRHPYINFSVANSIVKLRAQKGTFNAIEDLRESKLIDAILYEKLKPYVYL